jgi:cytochrome c-type biogenesis protein CcmF
MATELTRIMRYRFSPRMLCLRVAHMITELGHFALILAFLVVVAQMIVPMVGAGKNWPDWMAVTMPAAVMQFALTAGSFMALTVGFATSDFSIALVAANSNTGMPVPFKIAAVWSSYQGALLFWVLILTLFGAITVWFGGNLSPRLSACALAVQSAIAAAFFAVILFASNPFLRLESPPLEGAGANPLWQDPGLALYPLFLSLGTVGLAMTFSFAVAALIGRRTDTAWCRWLRIWSLAGLVFLTFGIGLGMSRAGTGPAAGGFQDLSGRVIFVLWPISVALACLAVLMKRRAALARWTILMSILGFGVTLTGIFILRSGGPVSEQGFISDPMRDLYGLAILAVFIGGACVLFMRHARALKTLSSTENARLATLMDE